MSGATSILPITAGGAVAGMGTTAGVLFALGVTKGAAVNFALASGLLLTSAAFTAAVLGLGGSLFLTLRARRPRLGGAALSRDDRTAGSPALTTAGSPALVEWITKRAPFGQPAA
jgi:hypothetical protein